jgi:hypothetical protein
MRKESAMPGGEYVSHYPKAEDFEPQNDEERTGEERLAIIGSDPTDGNIVQKSEFIEQEGIGYDRPQDMMPE